MSEMSSTEALARALFDAENTARPDEHPEEMPAYIERAKTIEYWLGFFGFEVAKKELANG